MVRWRSSPNLTWTHYDDGDEWVAYSHESADIHLVTAAARELWVLVSGSPSASFEELATALAVKLGRPLDDELTAATRDALVFMDRAGLVRPESS